MKGYKSILRVYIHPTEAYTPVLATLGTSVRKIDNLFFRHPPIFLHYVVLNHERSRGIVLWH